MYHGSAGSLEEEASWTKLSNLENAQYGWSVGTAGDVNGDGYADVIVGAPYWDGGVPFEGAAWVYLGQEDGLASAPSWYKRSGNEDAQFGFSVGTAGDVNGDGYDEVIVGAPYWSKPQLYEGAAFVYAGSSSGVNSAPAWSKASDQEGAWFGYSVGTAGDINGDGYCDVIVGAPHWDDGEENEGAAWVYTGSLGDGLSSAPAWYMQINQEDAEFGFSVSTAGDVNRDGFSDVIIGSPYWEDDKTNEGRAWVYLGSLTGLSKIHQWHAESNTFTALMGFSVSTAGDVNGDGYSDIIVGAPYYGDDGLSNEGKAWLFEGSPSGVNAGYAWTRESGQDGAQYGYSVSTAGDVNGDGYADVIVGVPTMDTVVTSSGAVRLYHGSSSGLHTAYDWKGEGDQGGAWYGVSVGTAGDVNGDGYADVIIGAHEYNGSKIDEGKVFVYYGNGGRGVALNPLQRQYSNAPMARLGHTEYSHPTMMRLQVLQKTPFGRGAISFQFDIKAVGKPFSSDGLGSSSFYNEPYGDVISLWIASLNLATVYHWRARLLFDPATTPFMPATRWFTMPWNGIKEADFRTAGFRFYTPLVQRGP